MVNANATAQGGGLRAARLAAGLSQQRVAELAKCSVGYVRVLESGYMPASDSDVVARIAAVLHDSRVNNEPGGDG